MDQDLTQTSLFINWQNWPWFNITWNWEQQNEYADPHTTDDLYWFLYYEAGYAEDTNTNLYVKYY